MTPAQREGLPEKRNYSKRCVKSRAAGDIERVSKGFRERARTTEENRGNVEFPKFKARSPRLGKTGRTGKKAETLKARMF